MQKELRLATGAALASHSSTPMGVLANNRYNRYSRLGGDENTRLDFSRIQRRFDAGVR